MKWKATAWPFAVIAVLALTVAANGFILYEANRGQAAFEPDYYRKALLWDSTMAQAGRNAALGWKLEASLGTDGRLTVTLVDAAGTPIRDARIAVEGFPIAFETGGFAATLPADDSTGYGATVPVVRAGLHELRFSILRGADRFTTVLRGEPGQPLSPKP
ncbi:MAG: FixH family protein [Gemmatimonadetes bacterium]|nr:FixH family protein [Gemmatimonadota bacterium]